MRTHAGPELAHLPGFRRKPEIGIYLLFLSYCERIQIFRNTTPFKTCPPAGRDLRAGSWWQGLPGDGTPMCGGGMFLPPALGGGRGCLRNLK